MANKAPPVPSPTTRERTPREAKLRWGCWRVQKAGKFLCKKFYHTTEQSTEKGADSSPPFMRPPKVSAFPPAPSPGQPLPPPDYGCPPLPRDPLWHRMGPWAILLLISPVVTLRASASRTGKFSG